MTKTSNFLSGGTALQALALMGAGLAGCAVVATSAAAQDFTNGAMVGVVVTPEGTRVSGGTVTVVSNAQGFTRTTQISADGGFRVPALPVGTYSVTVASPGFQSVIDRNVSVVAGSSATYTFTVAAVAAGAPADGDEIVVTGRAVRGNAHQIALGRLHDRLGPVLAGGRSGGGDGGRGGRVDIAGGIILRAGGERERQDGERGEELHGGTPVDRMN